MINAIITSGQIEASRISKPMVESITTSFIKRLISFAPFSIEPRICLTGIKVGKCFFIIITANPVNKSLCNNINGSLVYDLIFDSKKRVWPKHTRRLREEDLARW
jgi:hypothetical protein